MLKKLSFTTALASTLFISSVFAETYVPNNAKTYALNNVYTPYSYSGNPFPNVSGIGGNCTNFANQAVSAGLLGKVTARSLNDTIVLQSKYPKTLDGSWYYQCNNVSNSCQAPAWRGAQSMFVYSRSSGNKLNMDYVTKTSALNGKLQPFSYKSVKVGDIIFADWDWSSTGGNSADHSMVVTYKKKLSWWRRIAMVWASQKKKYNTIRVTYQSSNQRNVLLGSHVWRNNKNHAYYIYRPTSYNR